jgi:ACS family tartrate transporter-like MFS transporter
MPAMSSPALAPEAPVSEAAVVRKVTLRLIPFLCLLYLINLIDRTNISIARLQMVDDLGILSEASYGLGAGIFYVGYLLFEVPSNLILERTGARTWIARILVSWGLISSGMMFVTGPWSFAGMRILLGIAEAGFFPGIIFYLSHWFPARERARVTAIFMVAGVLSGIIGNPVSGFILRYLDGVAGLAGWQMVFLLEGIPAIVLGGVTLYWLTDRPEQATWLTPAERDWLARHMEGEKQHLEKRHGLTFTQAMGDPRVWLLVGVYFTVAMGDNAFGFYLPTFLKTAFPSWDSFQIGTLAAAPLLFAIVGMILVGWHSDRTGERRWHVAGSAFTAALGWTAAAFAPDSWTLVFALALTLIGMKSMLPTFWSLPTTFLTGTAAAGGIALINSVANLGGLVGPYLMGLLKQTTGGFRIGMLLMAVTLTVGGALVLRLRHETVPDQVSPEPSPSLAESALETK